MNSSSQAMNFFGDCSHNGPDVVFSAICQNRVYYYGGNVPDSAARRWESSCLMKCPKKKSIKRSAAYATELYT